MDSRVQKIAHLYNTEYYNYSLPSEFVYKKYVAQQKALTKMFSISFSVYLTNRNETYLCRHCTKKDSN